MLPQLLIIAAMGAALLFAARWLRQEVARVDDEMRRTQRSLARARTGRPAQLRFDAESGHYRPVED